jgi:hypothetical protein
VKCMHASPFEQCDNKVSARFHCGSKTENSRRRDTGLLSLGRDIETNSPTPSHHVKPCSPAFVNRSHTICPPKPCWCIVLYITRPALGASPSLDS